ncbi:MAG TPA: hypothetical protein PKC30_11290 [Saprospiraceae bacterium]|nr:hypothetical protein [Saprospiraceae bacterium]
MNFSNLLFLSLLFSIILISSSCKDKDSGVRDAARQSLNVPSNVDPVTPGLNSGEIVHHYICPNNCAGSGGPSDGTCPVCGANYLHNQAWHDQPSNQSGMQTIQQPITSDQMSGQNARGDWHYICSAGCAGGSGSLGNCASCGGALVHNDAYHN